MDLVCNLAQWAGCYKAIYIENTEVNQKLLSVSGRVDVDL